MRVAAGLSKWVGSTARRVRNLELRLAEGGYMGRKTFQDRMIPWARRWGGYCAVHNHHQTVMIMWAASLALGALAMLALVVVGVPMLVPLDVVAGRMWTWGTANDHAHPACAALCRLAGACCGVAAEAFASLEYAGAMWCAGMGAAALASEACSEAVSRRPQWAPQGRWGAMAGLNAFVLMGWHVGRHRSGPSPEDGCFGTPGLLLRVAKMGFSMLDEASIVAGASMPVGVPGSLWGPCAPCFPWSTPLDGIERSLAQSGGASPAEAHWIGWAKSLGEKRSMEARLGEPTPRMKRGGVKRL